MSKENTFAFLDIETFHLSSVGIVDWNTACFSSIRNNSYCHKPLPYLYLPYCFLVFLVSRFKERLCFVDQVSQVFFLQGKGGHKALARN